MLFPNIFTKALNDLLVVKIVILNQCRTVWNKITVVAAMLLVVLCRFIMRVEKQSKFFEILGSI